MACWGSAPLVIPPAAGFPGDLSYATAALIFLEYKDSAKWSAELLVAGYHGELKTYLVSEQSKLARLQFQLSSCYGHGITAVVCDAGYRLELVSGCETNGVAKATGRGIYAWRAPLGSLCIDR